MLIILLLSFEAISQTIEHEISGSKVFTVNELNSDINDKDKLAFILFINNSIPGDISTFGKWRAYFDKLNNKYSNIFELHVYKYPDVNNRGPKFNNISIHSSSLFVLSKNTFDSNIDSSDALFYTRIVDTIKDKCNITYFDKTSSKVCGEDVEFNNLQKPIEELIVRYKEFIKY